MTDVTLNRFGVDHVGFTMTTTGCNVASATLDKLLLDPTKEYVLRVNELNAPTSGIPLFGFDTAGVSLDVPLFVIRKRVVASNIFQFKSLNLLSVLHKALSKTSAILMLQFVISLYLSHSSL